MNKKYLGIVAGLLLLAGCANDENVIEQQGVASGVKTYSSFTATLDNASETRAQILDGDTNGAKQIVWTSYDVINVWTDTHADPEPFAFATSRDGVGYFAGYAISGNEFNAVFAPRGWNFDETNPSIIHFYLNDEFHAFTRNDFNFNGPMLATSQTNELHFKQLTGMVHVSIAGMNSINSAILQGNNDESISGEFYVDITSPEGGLKPFDVMACSNVARAIVNDQPLVNGRMDIYFIIPPTKFNEGFTLSLEGTDFYGNPIEFKKTYSKVLSVVVGAVKHFALFDVAEELAEEHLALFRKQLSEMEDKVTAKGLFILYESLGGENWSVFNGWGRTEVPVEQWDGLTFRNGKLIGLWLGGYNLSGAIPAEIATYLPDLEEIALDHNQITSIPDEFAGLVNLKRLILNHASLSGELPAVFGNMPNLEELHLYGNDFEGTIPDSWLTNLKNLKKLDLGRNKLTGTITKAQQQSLMWQSLMTNFFGFWELLTENQQDGFGMTVEGLITGIELSQDEFRLAIGETAQLDVIVLPEGNLSNLRIEIDNPEVASIDETGKITALAEGGTNIIFWANDGYGTATAGCFVEVFAASKEAGANEDFEEEDEEVDW